MRIAIGQLNFKVGAIAANAEKIIHALQLARDQHHADLIIFPELALTGYPLEDLLHRSYLFKVIDSALSKIKSAATGIDVIVGFPEKTTAGIFNSAVWIREQKELITYHKQKLPNYSVFDELRYFKPGSKSIVIELHGVKFGLLICEDAWYDDPVSHSADMLITINASPYSIHKFEQRRAVLQKHHKPIIYANLVGGQDELVFDGRSFMMDKSGQVCAQAHAFAEELFVFELDSAPIPENDMPISAHIYQALRLGVKDYVTKNNFPGVLIGLSGGIDSALTLSIAVDALGADNVTAVFMPSQYSADISEKDSRQQADMLGVEYQVIPIDDMFQEALKTLAFNTKPTVAEENLQARIRGMILMALSNKTGRLVLSTGNKSEMAVGYSTLYGDMVGGFCVLKDVFKTMVYQLANYRNQLSPAIPQRVIDRPPSAELAPNQIDQDTLPPYDILDAILNLFIEKDLDVDTIIAQGFDEKIVRKIIKMVLKNEYKRRQAPPGVRISEKAFGRDRRYPITSGYLV
ncbi:MAG: NAD+ synthase [Gammaproteobacteria bacterium RIFCSPHIGHO2_02_FULL_42_13]|nr:MAG: NAD+ synthase [Gammaproteobacteria bacterium RIFCSPHIGHO2_02_FULL_42_13]OGT69176.1 MAG: NAD+ synthase [Gammaproteobacteria bacterium RIFCSPLOWO2_02_FULL_42_9]